MRGDDAPSGCIQAVLQRCGDIQGHFVGLHVGLLSGGQVSKGVVRWVLLLYRSDTGGLFVFSLRIGLLSNHCVSCVCQQ